MTRMHHKLPEDLAVQLVDLAVDLQRVHAVGA
jgi:hypothetical protein